MGLGNWCTSLIMIVIGVALIKRPYPRCRPLTLGLVIVTLLMFGGWFVLRPTTETLSLPLTAARAEIGLPRWGGWRWGQATAARRWAAPWV